MCCAFPFLTYGSSGRIENPTKEAVVLSLLHVDEFEGGEGSRGGFLVRRGEAFNKSNKHVFVEVRTVTESQLADCLGSSSVDMVSFSAGVGAEVYPYLKPYDGKLTVRDELCGAGASGGKVYAVPWCMGGYVCLTRTGKDAETVLVGESAYSNPYPAVAACASDGRIAGRTTQYGAYERFLSGDGARLVGTQRDVIRCAMKMERGKLENVAFAPIAGYTDLLQCIGITASNSEKAAICRSFIEYITSEAVQCRLSEIGMINVLGECFMSGSPLDGLEQALSGRIETVNVFTPKSELERAREAARNALKTS